jgi:hypothetical protein
MLPTARLPAAIAVIVAPGATSAQASWSGCSIEPRSTTENETLKPSSSCAWVAARLVAVKSRAASIASLNFIRKWFSRSSTTGELSRGMVSWAGRASSRRSRHGGAHRAPERWSAMPSRHSVAEIITHPGHYEPLRTASSANAGPSRSKCGRPRSMPAAIACSGTVRR